MGRRIALTLVATVILSVAGGIAFTFPSHAYQTAPTSVDLAGPPPSALHTSCMSVGSFAHVSPPWQVDRQWPQRLGIFGAGIVLALVLLVATKAADEGRVRPLPAG